MFTIEEFIDFIIDLVEELYADRLEDYSAAEYLRHGGCLDLASILLHYYPNGYLMIKRDEDHYAIFLEGKVYDVNKEQNISDFRFARKDDIDNFYLSPKMDLSYRDGKSFVPYMIENIDICMMRIRQTDLTNPYQDGKIRA